MIEICRHKGGLRGGRNARTLAGIKLSREHALSSTILTALPSKESQKRGDDKMEHGIHSLPPVENGGGGMEHQ